jgi:hypothetical protein
MSASVATPDEPIIRMVDVAVTWNLALAPKLTDWLVGCLVMLGWAKPVMSMAKKIPAARTDAFVFMVSSNPESNGGSMLFKSETPKRRTYNVGSNLRCNDVTLLTI